MGTRENSRVRCPLADLKAELEELAWLPIGTGSATKQPPSAPPSRSGLLHQTPPAPGPPQRPCSSVPTQTPQVQHHLPCPSVPASTPISNRSCAAPKLRHRPSVPVPTQFSPVPQFLPGTSLQMETKKCERLGEPAHPEAVKVSRGLGQSSVSRGFILTYTT